MLWVKSYFFLSLILLLNLASLAYSDLKDGLVLYLPFDEGSGKVARDLSGKIMMAPLMVRNGLMENLERL
ncbi:MAG: hypothetical protein ACUVWN_09490 [bacterium]